jgi:transposase
VRATAAATGRPGDEPGDLWRRSLYGSLHRRRSSRRLDKAVARHLDLMWLLGPRRPAVKPIADFRRDNGAAIQQVCREFTLRGQALDRFGGELIAIAGSTLPAVNGQQRHFSGSTRVRLIEASDAKIAADLQQLDRQEAEETPLRRPAAAPRQQQLAQWQGRQPRSQGDQQPLQQSGEHQRALTDAASRKITRGDRSLVGDKVPGAVDAQYNLLVEPAVTQAVPDQHQLVPMAERANQP